MTSPSSTAAVLRLEGREQGLVPPLLAGLVAGGHQIGAGAGPRLGVSDLAAAGGVGPAIGCGHE